MGADVEAVAVNSATAGLHLALEAIGRPGRRSHQQYQFTHSPPAPKSPAAWAPNRSWSSIGHAVQSLARRHRTRHHAAHPRNRTGALRRPVLRHGQHPGDRPQARPESHRGRRPRAARLLARPAYRQPGKRPDRLQLLRHQDAGHRRRGMVVTRDPALAKRCRVMRLHGIDRDAFDRFTSKKPAWYYEIVAPASKLQHDRHGRRDGPRPVATRAANARPARTDRRGL